MKQTARLLTAVPIVLAVTFIAIFAGCEHDDIADGIEDAVEGTEFSELAEVDNFSTNLVISPEEISLEIGQTFVFVRTGGLTPIKWSVANPGHGSVAVRGSSQAIYTHAGPGNNDVIVREGGGHQAIAHITTAVDSLLLLEPTDTTISVDNKAEVFTVTGGSAPYTWTVDDPIVGSPSLSSGSSVTYRRIMAGDNVLTVTDAKGNTAQALITQP